MAGPSSAWSSPERMARGVTTKPVADQDCPCGSRRAYASCCGPFLNGQAIAPHAEALMRSRYTAFTRRDEAYLLATWHASTRPAALNLAADTATKWIGLDVKRFEAGCADGGIHGGSGSGVNSGINSGTDGGADNAIVEFVARYKTGGRAQRLQETSRFVREGGRWYYVEAVRPLPLP